MRNNTINQIAWSILSEDEQTALSLNKGFNKSSWEAGEIMSKSHYKLLEIKGRAEFFLKMFSTHLELYDKIIPEDCLSGDKVVIRYFELCIEQRKKTLDALQILAKEFGRMLKLTLNQRVIKTLNDWEHSENAHNRTIFNLVKDFDRWNNFRILPKEIQEPSAFKRRVKNAYKKQIRNACSIHPLAIDKILKLYRTKKAPVLYVPLMVNKEPMVLKLKQNKTVLNVVNTIGLYTFTKEVDANKYIEELDNYLSKGKKECRDGLEFWPIYREIIKKATNYHTVIQITPSRKYLIYALQKLEFV